jgi:CRISPR/Cas system-associated exonuclease Cas4 (RecB family)
MGINANIPAKVLPWSPTSLSDFETCPRRFYITRVSKQVREPQTAQLAEGNKQHKALENALKGTEGLPHAYKHYQPIIDRLRAAPGIKQAERDFALTSSFKPTGYWDKDAWVRGKVDVTIVLPTSAVVIDYKTGKVKESEDQAKLYAGVAFAENPACQEVRTAYIWLAHDKVSPRTFTREDLPGIWQEFTGRVKRMEHAASSNDFPPRPSGLCREWCPVGRSLCEHCGKP